MKRREFLKQAGLAAAASRVAGAAEGAATIIVEPDDYLANRPAVKWSITELQRAFKERGVESRVVGRLTDARPADHCILVAVQVGAAESVRLSQNTMRGRQVIQA